MPHQSSNRWTAWTCPNQEKNCPSGNGPELLVALKTSSPTEKRERAAITDVEVRCTYSCTKRKALTVLTPVSDEPGIKSDGTPGRSNTDVTLLDRCSPVIATATSSVSVR